MDKWTVADWVGFRFNSEERYWHRRFDSTCNSNLGYGAHTFISREPTSDEVASVCYLFPQYYRVGEKYLRLSCGLESTICVCDS